MNSDETTANNNLNFTSNQYHVGVACKTFIATNRLLPDVRGTSRTHNEPRVGKTIQSSFGALQHNMEVFTIVLEYNITYSILLLSYLEHCNILFILSIATQDGSTCNILRWSTKTYDGLNWNNIFVQILSNVTYDIGTCNIKLIILPQLGRIHNRNDMYRIHYDLQYILVPNSMIKKYP